MIISLKRSVTLFITFFLTLNLMSQIRGNEVMVLISPNHTDWNYQLGEEAIFNISVLKDACPMPQAEVDIEAGPVMYPDVKRSKVVLKDGKMTWKAKMTKEGFYRLKVTAHVGERT